MAHTDFYRPARSQAEVAEIMTARGFPMTRADLWHIEQSAIRKLRDALSQWYHEQVE